MHFIHLIDLYSFSFAKLWFASRRPPSTEGTHERFRLWTENIKQTLTVKRAINLVSHCYNRIFFLIGLAFFLVKKTNRYKKILEKIPEQQTHRRFPFDLASPSGYYSRPMVDTILN